MQKEKYGFPLFELLIIINTGMTCCIIYFGSEEGASVDGQIVAAIIGFASGRSRDAEEINV